MDSYGKLSETELAATEAALAKRLEKPCWNCESMEWSVFPVLLGEDFFDHTGNYMTSSTMGPKIRVTCKGCGNIAYFDALALGVTFEAGDA